MKRIGCASTSRYNCSAIFTTNHLSEDIVSLSEAISFFMNASEFEKNLSRPTLTAYSIDLKQLCDFATVRGAVDVSQINPQMLLLFVAHLKERLHLQDSSIRRKLAVLRSFFGFLEIREETVKNPFRRARFSFRQASKLPRVLARHEISSILAAAKESVHPDMFIQERGGHIPTKSFLAVRNNAILEILFYTGARVGEITGLNVSDCDFVDGIARFNGKGRRQRVIHLECAPVLHSLKSYLSARCALGATEPALFLSNRRKRISVYSIEHLVAKLSAKAGVHRRVTPHMFRHTMATMLLENGADLRTVQDVLGHSTIRTTQLYIHVSCERRRHVMADCHPRQLFWI